MKLKIKVKRLADTPLPTIIEKGDWIDLYCAEDTLVGLNPVTYIPLGVAMELPKGFEAIVAPRSSTPKNFNIWCSNSFGVIDNFFCGDTDEWKFPATTIGVSQKTILKGDRICQLRIQLSQKATMWQKIKWLLSSGVEIVEVDSLNNKPRGGFGSSGTR